MKGPVLRLSLVLLGLMLLMGVFAASALANWEDVYTPVGTTTTNPGNQADAENWWRRGWGTDTQVQMTLIPPTMTDGEGVVIGSLYRVDRNSATIIDRTMPDNYDRFGRVDGPYFENTFDMLGILADPYTLGEWDPFNPNTPGATYAIEGQWYLHQRYISSVLGYRNAQLDIPFGIDVTSPAPVEGLTITPGPNTPEANDVWVPTTRALIKWNPRKADGGNYDAVAGVGYFKVLIDGKELIPEATEVPGKGRVYVSDALDGDPFTTPSSVTIEKMPAGRHLISLAPVDRATNVGPAVDWGYFCSDPDTPTIKFTAPTSGFLAARTLISADAFDAAGDPQVVFKLDPGQPGGSTLATLTAPPYAIRPELAGLGAGQHTLTATVTDRYGRSVTVTQTLDGKSATGGFFPTDLGGLNTSTPGVSSTNPNAPESIDTWWRQGWGNSRTPDFTLAPPSTDSTVGMIIGMLYGVDRVTTTTIDATKPENYFRTARGSSTQLAGTVDMLGTLNYPPAGGWPPVDIRYSEPVEGQWYFHFTFFTNEGFAGSRTRIIPLGIDVTKPRGVAGLKVSPSLNPADAGSWSASSRAHITWTPGAYDDLSGVAYYEVAVDGKTVVPDSPTAPTQGRVYELAGKTPSSITVEDLPPGKHLISISAVDRATNKGPAVSGYFYSDPDQPTVAITSPSGGFITPKSVLTAAATDLGGIAKVEYFLDGSLLGASTSAPYSLAPGFGGVSAGGHELKAIATDMRGRTAMHVKSVTFDPVSLSVSGFSRTPSIFYPIRRDRYKDYSYIYFTLNKPAVATLTVRDSAGATVRTITSSRGAGRSKFVWDGKWSSDNKAHTGKYSYQVSAVDVAGGSVATGRLTTTIRNYELKKVGKNKVKVIRR